MELKFKQITVDNAIVVILYDVVNIGGGVRPMRGKQTS